MYQTATHPKLTPFPHSHSNRVRRRIGCVTYIETLDDKTFSFTANTLIKAKWVVHFQIHNRCEGYVHVPAPTPSYPPDKFDAHDVL